MGFRGKLELGLEWQSWACSGFIIWRNCEIPFGHRKEAVFVLLAKFPIGRSAEIAASGL
jgi:hypothetical protein